MRYFVRSTERALGCLFTAILVMLLVQPSVASASNVADASAYGYHTSLLTYDSAVGVALNQDAEPSVSMVPVTKSEGSVAHASGAVAHVFDSSGDLCCPKRITLAAKLTNTTPRPGARLPVHQPGSLSNAEARAIYLEGERGIASLADDLAARGVAPRGRALQLIETRNSLRTQARNLMADRDAAALLDVTDPNRTLSQLVGNAYRNKGLTGDDLWNYLADSASRSRPSVNDAFGLSP